MATQKLSISESVAPPVVSVQTEVQPVAVHQGFRWKVPSDWHIEAGEEGTIKAYCSKSAERFEGSIEDFNRNLK